MNPKQSSGCYDDQIYLLRELTASLPLSADSNPLSRDEIFRKVLGVICPNTYPATKNVPIEDLLPSRRGRLAAPYQPYPKSVAEGSIPPPHPEPRDDFPYARTVVKFPNGESYSVLPKIASLKYREVTSKMNTEARFGEAIGYIKPPRRPTPAEKDVVVEYQDGSGKSVQLSAPEAEAFRDKIAEWVDICANIEARKGKPGKRKRASNDDDDGNQARASTCAGFRPTKKLCGHSPPTIRIPSRAPSIQSSRAPTISSTSTRPISPGVIRIPPHPSSPSESTVVQTPAMAKASSKSASRRSKRLGKDNFRRS